MRRLLSLGLLLMLACFWQPCLFALGTQSQTIRFVPVPDREVTSAPFQVIALSSAFLPVTLAVQGPATLNGRLVTLTGVGAVTITASQAGNADYAAATAQVSFQSTLTAPRVSWTVPGIPYGTPIGPPMLNASTAAVPFVDASADGTTLSNQLDTSGLGLADAPVYPASSAVFRYEGNVLSASTYPNDDGGYIATTVPAPYGLKYRVAFTCDCQQFEFVLQARDGYYRLWVDGAYTSPETTPLPNSYPQRDFVLVKFPDKRVRQVKITVGGNAPFFGVNTIGGDTVGAPQVPIGERVIVFGDSWTGPTITPPDLPPAQPGLTGSGYPQTLAEYFNWDMWDDGVGGSGFTTPGTDSLGRTFAGRALTDICPNAPAAVLIMGGVNDASSSESAIVTGASETLADVHACLPAVPIYLYGPQTSGHTAVDEGLAAAVATAVADGIDISYTNMGKAGWFYGDSENASTGNDYLYLSAHPTPLGHDYTAEQVALDLMGRFPELAPKPYSLLAPAPLAGSYEYSVTAGAILAAGQHNLSVTFTPEDDSHYASQTQEAALTVEQASSSVLLKLSQPGALAPVTLSAAVAPQIGGLPSGMVSFLDGAAPLATVPLVNGAASFSAGNLSSGAHTFTAAYSGDSNFLPSTGTMAGSFVQPAPDFSVTAGQAMLTIASGQTGTVALQVMPVGGLTGSLTVSCSGLPAHASCSLGQPLQVGESGNPVSAQLQIATGMSTVAGAVVPAEPMLPGGAKVGSALALVALGLLGRRRRALWVSLLCVATLAGAGLLMEGCGASRAASPAQASTNAAPGTYSLTVTLSATGSAAIAHSVPLALTIQ